MKTPALRVTPETLSGLQHATARIRNICILAHVDHGKTTLSDSLVSANGIISEKLAGKIRFLDNTEEEQIRGITMKSSAISLVYQNERNAAVAAAEPEDDAPYLINLVDSPGHVDFSFDVSTAVRLCDGALVLIDAVEGVCAQTHAVIRQAWQEGIRPCLVINKMDRLIFELQYSPYEAYQRLNRILEHANAVLSSLIRADVLERHERETEGDADADANDEEEHTEAKVQDDEAITNETEEMEKELLFSPSNGNVLFASAVDGWAFNIGFFAHLYAAKLELPFRAVRQALWGDYYYNAKLKKIVTKPPTSNSQTMFCSFVLDPIWTTYKTLANPVNSDADVDELRKLMRQLRVGKLISDRDLKQHDRRNTIQAVMRKWLPLSTAVLKMVTRALPSPVAAQAKRAEKLCAISLDHLENTQRHAAVFRSLQACHTDEDAPAVVYICKMISVEANVLSDFHRAGLSPNEEIYVGVGRVYSGVLKAGQPIYVLDPKFQGYYGDLSGDENDVDGVKHVTRVPSGVIRPYMMMGRELHALDAVPAGNIVGIVGLHEHVLKTATLSSTLACPSLTKMPYQAKPIVRVAVEPEDPRNFAALEAGLQRLYRSDPTVEVQVQETGEHVIVALGELHLERCIKDLKERFAKVAVRVSEPLVGFRESITYGTTSPYQETVVFKDLLASATPVASKEGDEKDTQGQPSGVSSPEPAADARVASGTTPDGSLTLKVRAVPLPVDAAKLLEENADVIRRLAISKKNASEELDGEDALAAAVETEGSEKESDEFKKQLEACLRASENVFWKELPLERIWSCGPRRVGPNLLISNLRNYQSASSIFSASSAAAVVQSEEVASDGMEAQTQHETLSKLENSIITGFQMASAAGPLCDEPVWGVAFVIEDVVFNEKKDSDEAAEKEKEENESRFGPLSGQIISMMRTLCRIAFVKQPVRLVEAIYDCTVQCLAEQLGKLYSVISKRRGDIYSEELSDGSALFTVKASLPVIESFGFATDLLIQTSGAASNPQLIFSHWSVMELDPFFQPQTEEEREDFGERINEHNYVRKYIEAVRKRKGLARDEKIVVHAEKQRTLGKKR
uniref:Tr-type G domain-containing protein n=1 Tax=Globisporangium ultimum (strain ATCC 200006 / CBS 805.95 / DAOM BR144) TaxID=431595 RepID=K3WNV1_GLOUD